eukprot:6202312-Pleurochrysis_carterae.AAC.1
MDDEQRARDLVVSGSARGEVQSERRGPKREARSKARGEVRILNRGFDYGEAPLGSNALLRTERPFRIELRMSRADGKAQHSREELGRMRPRRGS